MKRFLLFACLVTPYFGMSQSFFAIRSERKLILTAGTGTATYFGGLSNPGTVINLQPNLNLGLQLYVTPRVAVRTELNWFVLHGDDKLANEASRKARGLSFRSNCFEISAIGEVTLYANGNRYYRRPTLNFYGFGGIGLLYFNPVADYKGKSYSLEPLQTGGVGYSRVAPVIPFGLGARLKITPNINFAIEGGYRKTFTSHLDDLGAKYIAPTGDPVRDYFINPNNPAYNPDAVNLPADEQNTYSAGMKRGGGKDNGYFLLNAKLEYYLPFNKRFGSAVKRKGSGLLKRKSTYRYNKRGGIRRR